MKFARRFVAVAWIAAVIAVFVHGAVGASGTKWITKRIPWGSQGGVSIPGGTDTILIAVTPDSNRTNAISTGDFAWEEAGRTAWSTASVTSSADTLVNFALLTLTCQARSTGNNTDTLYANPEVCWGGGCAHSDIVHTGVGINDAVQLTIDPKATSAAGLAAATTPYTLTSPAQVVFQGYIKVDPNSAGRPNNIWLKPSVRWNVASAASRTYYACRLYITYPQRAQP